MDQVEVRVGQVWQDNDKREYGRKLRVVEIVNVHIPGQSSPTGVPHAVVELVAGRGVGYGQAKPGRRTRIRLDRFKPTANGYRLVQDAPMEDA